MLNKNDFIKIGGWNTSFLTDCLCAEAIREEAMKEYGYPLGFESLLTLNSNYFVSQKSFKEIEKYILRKAKEEGPSFFTRLKEAPVKYGDELLAFSRKVRTTDLSKLTDDELRELFITFTELVKPRMAFGYFIQPFDNVLLTLLKEKLAPYLEREKIAHPNTFIVDLLLPERIASIVQEKTDLLTLTLEAEDVNKALEDVNFKDKLKKHQEKYGWMNNFDWASYPFSEEHYLEKMKKIKNVAREELNKIEEERKKNEEKYELLIREMESKGVNIRELAETIRDFVSLKMEAWETVSIAGDHCLNLFTEMGKRKGLSYHEVMFLSPKEILNINPKSKEKANKRRGMKGVLMSGNQINELEEKEVKKLLEEFSKVEETNEIKGDIGYPGVIQGRVSVALSSNQVGKVKEGDILVCPMTDPDYMIVADKIKAIITDHGGILCHAVIISREMKIPCVVGTKIATKTFKDGDLVEVNANEGIVRKLE